MTEIASGLGVQYASGPGYLLVRGGAAVLLPGETSSSQATRLYELLGAPHPVESVLGELLSAGLLNSPGFAVLGRGLDTGSIRVVVHGDMDVLVGSGRDHVIVHELRGIADRDVPSATPIEARLALTAAASPGPYLPLECGVVRASSCAMGGAGAQPDDLTIATQAPSPAEESDIPRVPEPEPAVEPVPEPEPAVEPVPEPEPAVEPVPEPEPAVEPVPEPEPEPEASHEPDPDTSPEPDVEPTSAPAPQERGPAPSGGSGFEAMWAEPDGEPEVPPPPAPTGLIETFPFAPAPIASPPRAGNPEPPRVPAPGVPVLEQWGGPGDRNGQDVTVLRPAPEISTATENSPASFEELTVARSQLALDGHSTLIAALRCPSGHLTPTYQAHCRVCRAVVDPGPELLVPRPTLGLLVQSSGQRLDLDRDIFLGRAPTIPDDFVGDPPHLVRLDDPTLEVSAQHLGVAIQDWTVSVTDLGSTNGTEVIASDGQHLHLAPWNPLPIEIGAVVILAGTVRLAFEAGP